MVSTLLSDMERCLGQADACGELLVAAQLAQSIDMLKARMMGGDQRQALRVRTPRGGTAVIRFG